MPRKDRVDILPDFSTNHTVQRGVNKLQIFRKEKDYLKCWKMMLQYVEKYKINIYHYCIMPSHIHLLVYVEEAIRLSKFMQCVSLSYSAYYRKIYNYCGYLWQGRFKSFFIEKDSYLLECARYIERNPLRAKYVTEEHISSYKWSSYNVYAYGKKDELVTIDPLYKTIGNTDEERQSMYREYVLTPRPYEESLDDYLKIN